jgi:hypothetical protein
VNDVEEFLEHYGVKGMKWGVRKADKTLGTHTKWAYKGTGKKKTKSKSGASSSDHVKKLSDEELKAHIARLDLERRYSELSNPQNKAKANKGAKLVDDILTQSGKKLGTTLLSGAGALAVAMVLEKKGVKSEHIKALTKVGK